MRRSTRARAVLLFATTLAGGCAPPHEGSSSCDADADCVAPFRCESGSCEGPAALADQVPAPPDDAPAEPDDAPPSEGPDRLGRPGLRDGAAYEIRRSDLELCLEVLDASDASYTGPSTPGDARQADCAAASHQRFWAREEVPGTFSLVNAHSGRCIEVFASDAARTNVVQHDCNGRPNQRWTTALLGEDLFMLANVETSKVLDVVGAIAAAGGVNGAPGDAVVTPFQGAPAQLWALREARDARFLSLAPLSAPGRRVRVPVPGGRALLGVEDDALSRFRAVPGLKNAAGVSFELKDQPGVFLREVESTAAAHPVVASVDDGERGFEALATFRIKGDLRADPVPEARMYESSFNSGRFLGVDELGQLATFPAGSGPALERQIFRVLDRD